MPRNGSGTYSLPEAAFIPNTPILAPVVNSDFDDIADALTDSLSRSGAGAMSAVLGLSTAGFSYSADPDTGMSRSGANTQVITVGGENYTFTTDDVTTPNGTSLLPLIGELRIYALPVPPAGWILMRGQACTSTWPLWRAALISAGNPYGTAGADPLFPDMRCVLPVGLDVGGRGLLTGSTVLGALLGTQTQTLSTANLPAYAPTGSVTKPDATVTGQNSGVLTFGGTPAFNIAGPAGNVGVSILDASLDSTPGFTGTPQGGVSTPVSVVQPTIVLNFIGRAA